MALAEIDLYVVLGLAVQGEEWTYRDVAAALELPVATLHKAAQRTADAGLFDPSRRRVRVADLERLLVHAAPYVLPARRLGMTVGVPTGPDAPVLAGRLRRSGGLPLVWPHADGEQGEGLAPLHPSAPAAALADPNLYALLALVDALRAGDARVREVAGGVLAERLTVVAAAS